MTLIYIDLTTPDGKQSQLMAGDMSQEELQRLLTDHESYLMNGSPRGGRYRQKNGEDFTLSFKHVDKIGRS